MKPLGDGSVFTQAFNCFFPPQAELTKKNVLEYGIIHQINKYYLIAESFQSLGIYRMNKNYSGYIWNIMSYAIFIMQRLVIHLHNSSIIVAYLNFLFSSCWKNVPKHCSRNFHRLLIIKAAKPCPFQASTPAPLHRCSLSNWYVDREIYMSV